ncbi:Bifunctional solanapyrone synthase [Cytospora mali]|uniref:Bifunctional solanapyrone synthase n=1 Tax=Cytospora mali TaxID=578113 RepID=A0A194UVJ9_CYTMA|nr:Bifunctional solanapyrone synthase [Valsa mali var. pyri (nom. inval.)]
MPVKVWQEITIGELEAMRKNGGNPLGLAVEEGPLYIILIVCRWKKEEDDAAIYQMVSTALKRIKLKAASLGLQNDFVYMNYASMFQDVISSYGSDNKARLKDIASKYDPARVFQELQPGHFELDKPPVSDSGYFSF